MRRQVLANSAARGLALLGVSLAAILVARLGGPEAVGSYALLRILPGVVGVVAVAGLPGALAWFLAPERRGRPGLWPTIAAILAVGSVLGTLAWLLLTPVVQRLFFPADRLLVVAAAGVLVATQLLLTVAKTALQGLEEHRQADVVIAAEELAFLPCFALLLLWRGPDTLLQLIALAAADLLVAGYAWRRVAGSLGWRGLGWARAPRGWRGAPRARLAGEVVGYGVRGQTGGLLLLANARLDFVLLAALAGPATLGLYAVAAKYAEITRLPALALTWVSYPRFAATTSAEAGSEARRWLPLALAAVGVLVVPFLLAAPWVLELLYGARFADAAGPARILLLGMLLAGGAGLATGFLYGRGRPGRNSLAVLVGLVVTVVLDLLLIPRFGAVGAAWASTASYLLTDALLIAMLLRGARPVAGPQPTAALVTGARS